MAIINSKSMCRGSRDGEYFAWNPDMETAIDYHDPFQYEFNTPMAYVGRLLTGYDDKHARKELAIDVNLVLWQLKDIDA